MLETSLYSFNENDQIYNKLKEKLQQCLFLKTKLDNLKLF